MGKRAIRLPSKGLLQARRMLRQEQMRHLGDAKAVALKGPILTTVLARLDQCGEFEPTPYPGYVRRGGFRYERKLEERRIALAKDLVRRTSPGPDEDPVYLAMLAYQAASLEMALPDREDGRKTDMGWSRFLLGTIHSPELNAFAQSFKAHYYTVVALHSALIEFAYQAAKAVVAARHPVRSTDGKGLVTINTTREHLTAQLESNPEPIDRLYRTLEAYFFNGYPRAFHNEKVPAEQQIPLGLLIGMAERWIIGHEYGHGFAAGLDWRRTSNPHHAEEYFADEQATTLTVQSAARLDAVQPEIALAGGAFALASLEVFQRALSILRHGRIVQADSDTHPSNEARAAHIAETFERFFEFGPANSPERLDLNFVLRADDWQSVETDATRMRRERIAHWPDTLLAIWDLVLPRLRKDFEDKRPLHAMWR